MKKAVPRLVIIAGPNGSGKTTLSEFLREHSIISTFLNADIIAQGLSVSGEGASEIQAGKAMLKRIHGLLQQRADFAFETTLSGKTWMSVIKDAKRAGYEVFIYFVTIDSPQKTFARVCSRFQEGGHFIPETTVFRRYFRSHTLFWNVYRHLVDEWTVFDNSDNNSVVLLSKDSVDSKNEAIFLKRLDG